MDNKTLLIVIAGAALAGIVLWLLLRKGAAKLEKLPPEKLAQIAAEKAEAYVHQHKSGTGEDLGFLLEDLKKMDQVLEKNFARNLLDAHTIDHMGMYLGETIRRLFGGQWRYNEGFGELCLELEEEGFIFPVSQIRRALEHKESGQVRSYVESIAERQRAAKGQ